MAASRRRAGKAQRTDVFQSDKKKIKCGNLPLGQRARQPNEVPMRFEIRSLDARVQTITHQPYCGKPSAFNNIYTGPSHHKAVVSVQEIKTFLKRLDCRLSLLPLDVTKVFTWLITVWCQIFQKEFQEKVLLFKKISFALAVEITSVYSAVDLCVNQQPAPQKG